jgi:hypothetical protein
MIENALYAEVDRLKAINKELVGALRVYMKHHKCDAQSFCPAVSMAERALAKAKEV